MKKEVFENRDVLAKNTRELETELDKLDKRFAYGNFDNEVLYHRFRSEKLKEIDQIKEQLQDSEIEISNLELAENIIEVVDYMEHIRGIN